MIETILIKNTASYDEAGIRIGDLRKINFIYGGNGSGKTTISNFIANQTNSEYQACSVTWKHSHPLKSLVYNKKFREHNFGKGTIEGVFTLGEATKEEIELIEKMRGKLKVLKEEGVIKATTLKTQNDNKKDEEDDFKEKCWINVYKKYEHDFKDAFKGFLQKESFKNKLLLELDNNRSSLLTFEELKEKSKIIFGKVPETIPYINIVSFDRLANIENEKIWIEKIIGKLDVNIAKLIQKLNINDWVNHGRNYILDENICPFCQQDTITEEFKKQLEEYFDESFMISIKRITDLKDEYNRLVLNLINELTQVELNEKANSATKLKLDTYSAYLKTLSSQITSNQELLGNKIKEPSRSIQLIETKEQLRNIEELIVEANKEIKIHNEIVNNYKIEKNNLTQAIWRFIVEDFKQVTDKHRKKTAGLQKGIQSLGNDLEEKRKAYSDLNDKIKELNKNVTSIQPTVDEINRTLQSYGFFNFEIVPSESNQGHYQIKREDV